MTIPGAEGPEIPEIPEIPLPPSEPLPAGEGASLEMQSIRLLAGTIFAFIKTPAIQMPLGYSIPTQKMPQHALISQLINKFNPSFTQLAVLSHVGQPHPTVVDKPAAPPAPKEASPSRDEAAPKDGQGPELTSLEVFAAQEPALENKPSSATTQEGQSAPSGSAAREGELPHGGEAVPPAPESAASPSTPQEKTNVSPPKSESQDAAKESFTQVKQPSQTKEVQAGQHVPLAPKAKEESLVRNAAGEKPYSEEKSTLAKPADPNFKEGLASALPDRGNQPAETAKSELKSPLSEGLKQETEQKLPGKDESGRQSLAKPQKSEDRQDASSPAFKTGTPSKEDSSLEAAFAPYQNGSTENPPISKHAHSGKEEKPAEASKVEPLREDHALKEARKIENKSVYGSEPSVTNRHTEETVQTANHRIFQPIDHDTALLVPPWLAQLLPDLTKTELSPDKRGKGKAGAVKQNPHKLSDMLFMLLCSSLGGAKTLPEVLHFIESREKWFTVVLGLKYGLPPRQLFFWLLTVVEVGRPGKSLRPWLLEAQGQYHGTPRLLDIIIWQTSLGFILGQEKFADAKPNIAQACWLAENLRLEGSVLMTRTEDVYGSLLAVINQRRAYYIAEVDTPQEPSPSHESFESYLEGQQRTVLEVWRQEDQAERQMKASIEVYLAGGADNFERYYISNLEKPAGYYFDLSQAQKPYENSLFWSLNTALSLPSIEEAIKRGQVCLGAFEEYAKELIESVSDEALPVEEQMKKAAADSAFLLRLSRGAI